LSDGQSNKLHPIMGCRFQNRRCCQRAHVSKFTRMRAKNETSPLFCKA
jgi:hypothetical protein